MLNSILRKTGSKIAVIENEVGQESIDDKLINSRQSMNQADEVVLMPNGCMCCRVRGDLVDALKRMIGRANEIDGVILEMSGLSNLAPVVQTFFSNPFVQARLKLVSVVCTLDASRSCEFIGNLEISSSALVREQLSLADTVIVNKLDLLPTTIKIDNLHRMIKEVNPICDIHDCTLGSSDDVLPKRLQDPQLLNADGFSLQNAIASSNSFEMTSNHHPHHHDSLGYSSVCIIETAAAIDYKQFSIWLEESVVKRFPEALVRYKGFIWGKEGTIDIKVVMQGVYGHVAFTHGGLWNDSEEKKTVLVFIGRIDDPTHGRLRIRLERGLQSCLVKNGKEEKGITVSQFAFIKSGEFLSDDLYY